MKKITSEIRKQVLDLLENGEKVTKICKKLGISRPTLVKIRNENENNVNENVENVENESESVKSESESESENESVNLPKEILLRGRGYRGYIADSESEIDSEIENRGGENDVLRNYFSRYQKTQNHEEENAKPEKPQNKITPQVKPQVSPQIKIQNEKVSQSESKQAKITKISAYFKSFPMKVAPITGGIQVETYLQNLQVKNEEELDGVLAAIRYRISNSGLSDGMHLAFITASRGVENISCRFGLKLQGYADSLATNQNVRDILSEMSIEYLSDVALEPHKRLILICGLQAYSVHTKNSTEEILKNVLDQEVDESKFENKVNDNNEFKL